MPYHQTMSTRPQEAAESEDVELTALKIDNGNRIEHPAGPPVYITGFKLVLVMMWVDRIALRLPEC